MIFQHIIYFIVIIFFKGIFTSASAALLIMERKRGNNDEKESEDSSENIFGKKSSRIRLQRATISIVNVILVMGLGFLCTSKFIESVLRAVVGEHYFINYETSFLITLIVIVILLTYFTVLFGSIIPERFARKNYKAVLRITRAPVEAIHYIFYLFTKLINISVNIFNIFFDTTSNAEVTQEEIIQLINEGEEKGAIDENEKEMINNIFEFDDKTAGDIATHRKDIVAIDADDDIEEIIKLVVEEKYSRIPVYKDNIDNITGILYTKDFLKYLLKYGKDNFNINDVIMKPFFVPFTKKTDELFEQMQRDKIHLSVVIDEYGGTAGIVTMEDLIEEVMGNILDEYDEEEIPVIQKINENIFIIDGTAETEEVEETLGITVDSNEFDTIGGFLISKIGKIPEEGENYNIEYEGFIFKTEKVDEKRISLIRAERIEDNTEKGLEESETEKAQAQ